MENNPPLDVHILPALKDNYIYVLNVKGQNNALVIDPSESHVVVQFLKQKNWQLEIILNTHHHADHVGGNADLLSEYPCEIWCSDYDLKRIPGATRGLRDGEKLAWNEIGFEVLKVPGHTLGAIAYHWPSPKLLFTGDTLFTLGCGRLFEGTADQLWKSLHRLMQLPNDTLIYSGHEYGLNNTGFAHHILPNDPQVALFWERTRQARLKGLPSVPSSVETEKRLNPFIKAKTLKEFTQLRLLKDDFRLEDHDALG